MFKQFGFLRCCPAPYLGTRSTQKFTDWSW